jgi:hypothetical protein
MARIEYQVCYLNQEQVPEVGDKVHVNVIGLGYEWLEGEVVVATKDVVEVKLTEPVMTDVLNVHPTKLPVKVDFVGFVTLGFLTLGNNEVKLSGRISVDKVRFLITENREEIPRMYLVKEK